MSHRPIVPPFLLWPFLPGGRFWLLKLVFWLVVLAGAWELLVGDIDAFEARTGFFDRIGTWIINGIVALVGILAAIHAASLFFPRSWGDKAGIGGAIVAALIALFCFSVLWQGGA
jgi:hypothetical protein